MPAPPRRPSPPEVCPVCGEDVPRNARACPACGADERSGWHPDADAHAGEEDGFDYDRFIREEFDGAGGRGMRPQHVAPLWWAVGVILLLLMVWGYFLAGGFK